MAFWERLLRGLSAQLLPFAPELINFVAGLALPVIPPPFNVLVGVALNAIGSQLRRRDEAWKWVPV